MKPLVLLTLLVFGCIALPAFAHKPQSYYQPIIDALPFGPMATHVASTEAQEEIPQEIVEELSNEVSLCAMTITPDGRVAVGLIDKALNPPAYIVLFDNDINNGLELVYSDYDTEVATFKREGVLFSLQLGLGLIETITPQTIANRKAQDEKKQIEEAAKRPPPNSLAEQLISMQMSLPPDIEAPPLPIPMGDPEIFTRSFDPNREQREPETEEEAIVQAGVEELKAAVAAGETPQDYLKRLVEHRQKEVERQQEEKRLAQETLDAQLAEGHFSQEDETYIRRRTNIELIKKGVVPLSPVEDITEEEEKEINAALDALD